MFLTGKAAEEFWENFDAEEEERNSEQSTAGLEYNDEEYVDASEYSDEE